ncbi:HPr family phosphocarrier protein, partial [Escherichia coli]|uniref:HPr family phosphocarrier protein n=1 Tax=Escherichia coli TaxID=562 RepID=UPI00215856B8
RLAHAHEGAVTVIAEGRDPVDAASILGVMTLGVDAGDTILVRVDGPDAAALLARITALLDPA